MDKKKKQILIAVTAVVLAVAGVLTWVLIPKTPTQEVHVYSYDMIGYVNYYSNSGESYGLVTTDRVQSLYVSDTQKVTEILVYQGQEVKKGDVLYRYDTTLSDMEVERKDLSIQQMEVNLKQAKEDLKTLKAMKPMVLKEGDDEEEDDATKIPEDVLAESVPYSGSGTNAIKPFKVWVKKSSSVAIDDQTIASYFEEAGKSAVGDSVFVVFCIADGPGETITEQIGIKFTLAQRIVESLGAGSAPVGATEGTEEESSEPTEPETTEEAPSAEEPTAEEPTAEEPTTEETQAEEPEPDAPTVTESDETCTVTFDYDYDGKSEEQTVNKGDPIGEALPADPVRDGYTFAGWLDKENSNPVSKDTVVESDMTITAQWDPVPEKEEYYEMRFFSPTSISSADTGDEIIWNSGYTYSELVTMRNEKAEEINELTFNIKIAKAELAIMKKEADSGEVLAEFDGIVTSVLEPQNATALNVPMIKVSGGGGFYVEGSVSELDLNTVQVGQSVTVTSWETYTTYEGTIVEIGQYPTEENSYYSASNLSYYPYKVFIEDTADLQEGYYVSMTYQTEVAEEGIMYLESAFLLEQNGTHYVYVRGEDGLLEKREVQAGESSDGYMTQILGGLSQTDYIAFPYGKDVVEGAPTVEGAWEDLYGY